LEKLHPFQGNKFHWIKKKLLQSKIFSSENFIPAIPQEELILSYLSPDYKKQLRSPSFLAYAMEIPILRYFPYFLLRRQLLVPMLYGSSGTIQGAFLALEHKLVINLGGGFHHACFHKGHGFCLFPDIPIAIREVQKNKQVKKVAVVDCDAHQGDGTERALAGDKNILMIDCYQNNIFPLDHEAKKFIDIDLGFDSFATDKLYLDSISEFVLPALEKFQPELIIYGAGTDVYEKDPLTRMKLTKQGIIQRDSLLVSFARQKDIPLLMVLSGGYHADSADIVAESILQIATIS
jgi:histone deacetylase 11